MRIEDPCNVRQIFGDRILGGQQILATFRLHQYLGELRGDRRQTCCYRGWVGSKDSAQEIAAVHQVGRRVCQER
jgi:hypothetical protein